MPVDMFVDALKLPDIQEQVPINKRELLYERAMKVRKHAGAFTFDDFVNVVSFSIFIVFFLRVIIVTFNS